MDGIAQSDRDDLDQRVGPLANRFVSSGYCFFLVGGVVRNLFLGERSKDIDITTDAYPERSAAILEDWAETVWRQGERFGTIGARKGNVHVEVTTHRSEHYMDDSRKPQVAFSGSIHDDLGRRDFTVNAMAIEVPSWELVDPYGGRSDLARRVLRTPLGPDIAFSEDPLRMLRAARFSSGYSLVPEQDLEDSIRHMADRLAIVSRERINDELTKLLLVDHPSEGLALLQRTGLLNQIFPTANGINEVEPEVLDLIESDLSLRWAGLLWAMADDPKQGRDLLKEVRVPNSLLSKVVAIVEAAHELSAVADKQLATLRRLLHVTRPNTEDALVILGAYQQSPENEILEALRQLELDEGTESFDVPLDGFEIAKLIEEEGPPVGVMLRRLLEYQLEQGPLSEETARELVLEWKTKR